ncbi:23875_t:CDS:2, partial [Gigaspora rosea]
INTSKQTDTWLKRKTIQIRHVTTQPIKVHSTGNILEHLQTDYQSNKMRTDVEIKKLLQKEEQEIIEILGEYKNRTLKKDNVIAEYLGIQHVELVCIIRETIQVYDYIQHKIARRQQVSAKEIELLETNKNQNQPNKVVNQLSTEKDMLLQLECGIHNYGTREIQTIMNLNENAQRPCKRKLEARELQEEIIRIDRKIHLIEKESSTDTKLDESSPSALKEKSLVIKDHKPSRENPPEVEPSTSTGRGNIGERNAKKQQEWFLQWTREYKVRTWRNQLSVIARKEITRENPKKIKERSSQHKQSRHEQQTNEEHSTSPFQTSGQILA